MVDDPGNRPQRKARLTSRDWYVMAALMVGIMLSPINVMFTSVALPTLRDAFAVNVEQVTWIATAYFIPSVVFMPVQAQIGDQWGQRRTYALGLLLLSAGSLLAALSRSFQFLLAGRALQGVGWSALYPLALILIRREYPSERQGEMMGLWESSVGLATIVSPVVAGGLVQYVGWRSLFVATALVAGMGALLTWRFIPASGTRTAQPSARVSKLDLWGLTLALFLSLLGIARRNGLILALALLAWLVWLLLARRSAQAAVQLRVLRNRHFLSASFAAQMRMLAAIAALTALPLFFEDVQGLTPSRVGGLMVIYSLFLFLASWPGGRWADRSGAAVPGSVGFVAMLVGVLLLLPLGVELMVWLVALALAIRGVGAGLSQAPYAKAATESITPADARAAAGLYGTIRYSGLALGTALVGIFLQLQLARDNALTGGAAALPAFRELWLVISGVPCVGLGLTVVMHQQTKVLAAPTLGD